MFKDNTPGYNVKILLIQEKSFGEILDTVFTDDQGYYTFYGVEDGTYWINTVTNNSYVSNEPSAIVTVVANNTSRVEDLTVYKDLYVLSINNSNIDYLNPYRDKTIISGHRFTFTWTAVVNATNYEVEIESTYTQANPSNKDYDSTVQTTNHTITWSQDLSSLPYQEFRIDITAYSIDNSVIAENYESFTVSKN